MISPDPPFLRSELRIAKMGRMVRHVKLYPLPAQRRKESGALEPIAT